MTTVYYLSDIHYQHINDWIKDDKKFIVTIATRKIFERLKTDNCVLVVGRAGNGKSSIVRHIALDLRRKYQHEIIPLVRSPSGIFEFIDRKGKQIFIVDDLCGKVNINAQSVDDWFSQIDEILKLIYTSGKSNSKPDADIKFLFATGSNIYDDSIFQKLKLLQKYVFQLSDWPLTDDEKLKMIKNYISPEAETKLLQKLKSDEAYFPLLCKIAERKTADQIIRLFNNLKDFIKQDLIDLKETNNLKFCVITLCALLNNRFKEEMLNDVFESDTERQAFKKVCLEFNIGPNKDTVKRKIKEQLNNLEDMYVAKTESYYHFIHSEVYHIAVLVCGQTFLHSFIKFVRGSFIAERFCFESIISDIPNNKHIIIICDENTEKRYFDRLMFDLEKGNTYSTFHNNQLQSESYRAKFCSYCETRQQKVSELLKHFSEKSYTDNVSSTEKNYEDYTAFSKQHHFFSHKMRKPLIESAWEGYADIVHMLLKSDCDINEADRFGRTALYVACLLGKEEVVKVLLNNNANHSLCDDNGQSPLLVASREGHDTIVDALLQNNADLNACDVNGNSPLLVASFKSNLSTVQILSNNMTDFSKVNNLGQTPVFVASMKGRENVVKYLLSVHSEYILKPDNEGRSPLFIACREGYPDVVNILLRNQADVSQLDWNKRSPLFIASAEGYKDIVSILIQNNAKINQCDEEGRTPLFIASDKGRTGTVKNLVSSGADLNATDDRKCTPLYAACRRGFIDIVKLLYENHASITQCNTWNSSPVFAACRQGYVDIVKYLLQNGCNISGSDFSGTTPLLVACENGNTEIVNILIQQGADINQSDQSKKTPLHASAAGGHAAIVKLLIIKGAITTLTNSNNQTPLDLARKHSYTDIVKLLLTNK
ncbi:unnamed protein product [Mytilus coruscus]|uniref:Novel STAND NTPase 3 domain-containing protein n=1 Tax=Mytilus coruscus TaxID=42192 RepID=A0A6J8ER49_MYTCO|nr:unnamed protein product [Mytilus coruscus]